MHPILRDMKIIGFIGIDGAVEMVLKGDSCLLNNRKPFFLPEPNAEIRMTPCMVLRVSRLGKHIAPKFASRYYDAVAHGADFQDEILLAQARKTGGAWTQAIAFDYSLAIGEWIMDSAIPLTYREQDAHVPGSINLLISPEEAIAEVSKLMTIRQGDLIYIQRTNGSRIVKPEEVIEAEGLYCKVK